MFEKLRKGEKKSLTGPGQPRSFSHPTHARPGVLQTMLNEYSIMEVCIVVFNIYIINTNTSFLVWLFSTCAASHADIE